ncbi:MAG: beta-ketoacyl-[acyl-carrier-protein] synthase II [Flavobacteriaceae bacterium]|nr:beta-ketoacyl-[acyl-carrier-protein] synthase II [Flavobacteriaceae bacterium]
MQLPRRVVVTGMGLISPLGNSVQESWSNCINGQSGITDNHIDLEGMPIKIGGRIKDFDPTKYIDAKDVRRLDTFVQYGVSAGIKAIEDAGLDSNVDKSRVGLNIGSGIGGLDSIEKNKDILNQKSFKRVSPFFVPGSIINMTPGYLSIVKGYTGPNLSIVTACASSNHAIGTSARLIAYGDADIMVTGGSEMATTPLGVSGFLASRALSKSDDPSTASRPWDKDRDGFVLSDGAAILVLEEYEHAKNRSAKIYAEIIGFGMSSDAYHMTAPSEDGTGAALSISRALLDADITANEIDYINAHATSTPLGDLAECNAVKSIFDRPPPISSTKSMTGHTLGAAGAVESIFSILSIVNNVAPPTINLDNPDEGCDLDFIPNEARNLKIDIALNNSFGFGGTNSTLIYKSI